MDTPKKKRQTGEQTLRVRPETHQRFMDLKHELRARSADELVDLLVAPNTVKIPLGDVVRARWEEAAKAAGYEVDHWVALIVESYIAYGASPGRIENTLSRSLGIIARASDILRPAAAPERPKQGGGQAQEGSR